MMIDFALEAERHQGLSGLRRHRAGLPVAVSSHHDDHAGRLVRRAAAGGGKRHRRGIAVPLGISIIGGLLLSQLLTLYTTPVVYLALDRVNRRIEKAVPPPGARTADTRPSREPPRGCSNGLDLRAVHPPAGRHHPARDRAFLVGVVAYDFLPVAAVPNVDYPSIRVSATRPGADPAVMAATVAAPAGAPARRDRGHRPDHLHQFTRLDQYPVAIRHRPRHRPRRARRAGRDQRLARRPAERPADAAALSANPTPRRRRYSSWR